MGSWTTGNVLAWAASDFGKRGFVSPRLEAEVLLVHVLGCRRLDLYTQFDRPLMESELQAFRNMISRRRSGEPVAYIIGKKEFWSLDFEVDSRVLVPRPETETLVETVLDHISDNGTVLELCTGSGCVAVALASERPNLRVDAVDISADACLVARKNVENHRLTGRITVMEGDLFEPLCHGQRYNAVVANPPYVAEAEIKTLALEVQAEPAVALAGGKDGLDVVRRILGQAASFLEPGGWLALEVDPRQVDQLVHGIGPKLLGVTGRSISDLSGRKRVVLWQLD